MTTQSSFYGDTPNYATDYPTQNDSNTNPANGNTPAPSSFYPNGTKYATLADADALTAEIDADLAAAQAAQAAAAASAADAAAAANAATAATALKADKTYVDAQDALKADKTYVDAQDALKANKTYVDAQDALLAARLTVSVKDFGAKGDGSTDDTATLNSAIAAQNAGNFGTLYWPKGTYIVTSLNACSSNGAWIGDGRLNTVIKTYAGAGDIVTITGGLSIDKMSIDSSVSRNSGYSLKLAGNHSVISNFGIYKAYIAVYNIGSANHLIHGDINAMTSRNVAAGSGAVLVEGGILTAVDVAVGSATAVNNDMAEFGWRCRHGELDMTQCYAFQTNHGLLVDPGASQIVLGVSAKGCWFDTTISSGAKIAPAHSTAILEYIWIVDSWLKPGSNGANGYGLIIDNTVGATMEQMRIIGNNIQTYSNGNGYGVYLLHTSAPVQLELIGNGIGANGSGFFMGLQVLANTKGWIIANNTIARNGQGFEIQAGCDNYVFAGNRLEQNSGSAGSNASTPTSAIKGPNVGFKTEAFGEAIVTPSSGIVTIAHGLSAAPSVWMGEARSASFVGTQPYSADATNIRFSMFDASGALINTANMPVQWKAYV